MLEGLYDGFEALPGFLKAECLDAPYDVQALRADFPILRETVNGRPLVWLDNAATTQKPRCVIDRLLYYYEHENSNVHRAAHTLARRATDAYEGARRAAAGFLGASFADEIVFVRGATEAINLVASSWGPLFVREGDEILITELEHHANIVPWQFLCRRTGARLVCCPVDDSGQIDLSEYKRLLSPRTKLAAFSHVSNVLGTIAPAREMAHLAHGVGAAVLIDGAQAAAHMPVDVRALEADFYVFSGHKLFGPTGIGVLYGRYALLGAMAPYQGGGNMITSVTLEESRFKEPPHRFEAGTGSIADAAALESAVRYVSGVGLDVIARYEEDLLAYLTERLRAIPGLTIVGNAAQKAAVVSFYLVGVDSDGAARSLDAEGIAVRAGHHCAQPALRRFGLEKAVRASLAMYNTYEEIDVFTEAVGRIARSI